MSHKDVEQIISRAVVDEQFRELLFTSPNEALAGHDLTADERQALQGLSREKFDNALGDLALGSATGGQGTTTNVSTGTLAGKFDWSRIGYAPSNTN
jgi:hypothetical protein